MSAFIVSENTMHRVVGAVLSNTARFVGIPTDTPEAGDRIGRVLYDLNTAAVNYRYSDDETAPEYSYSRATSLRARPVQALKSIRCLLYQCSEGNVPEKPAFRELEEVSHSVALEIVRTLPDWDQAGWD